MYNVSHLLLGIRLEEIVYSKLDKTQRHHPSPHELLGVELGRAGNEYGPETQYGMFSTI